MQLHYGAQRNTNTAMFNKLGADTGFDCISVKNCGEALTGFLNAFNVKGKLPKTIIYSPNPNDNELIDTVLGCFQGTEAQGKIQHGSAWWLNRLPTFRFSGILWVCLPSQGAFCPTPATSISEEYSAIFWANGWKTANIPTIK